MEQQGLPLGICKQALMKLESAMQDFHEIAEDECLNDEQRLLFESLAEISGQMMASIVNFVQDEINEEDFINEHIDMDVLSEEYPADEENILDMDIG